MIPCKKCGGSCLEEEGEIKCFNCGEIYELVSVRQLGLAKIDPEGLKNQLITVIGSSSCLFEMEYDQSIQEGSGPVDAYFECQVEWMDPERIRTLIKEWLSSLPKDGTDNPFLRGMVFALSLVSRFMFSIGKLRPSEE